MVWGVKEVKKKLANFSFEVVGYGKPSLSGNLLTVPLKVRFNNPTPLPINIDNLLANIYLLKNNQFVYAAQVNQPVSMPTGIGETMLYPVIDIKSLFGGDLISTLTFINSTLNTTKKLTVRTDVTTTYKGVPLPSQSFTNTIDL